MIVGDARDAARRWVVAEAAGLPGFRGAFYHGSTNWLPGDAVLPATSDVDVMVVLEDPESSARPGKFRYQGALLEVSYLPDQQFRSPETVLGLPELAGSFRTPGIISDPSGRLAELQRAVSGEYAQRRWVRKRCEGVRGKIFRHLRSLDGRAPFHDGVTAWLFATGNTANVLLAAGLKNPTVRRRYEAVRELLAEYGRPDFHESLLDLLGCARMSRERTERHLASLADAFDAAKTVVETPFFFAADISDVGRPVAIDGSRELIEHGLHREAVFWIVATYARCQKILHHDASAEKKEAFAPGFRCLLADLGITSFGDLERRGERVEAFLPRLWEVAEAIMADNRSIEG